MRSATATYYDMVGERDGYDSDDYNEDEYYGEEGPYEEEPIPEPVQPKPRKPPVEKTPCEVCGVMITEKGKKDHQTTKKHKGALLDLKMNKGRLQYSTKLKQEQKKAQETLTRLIETDRVFQLIFSYLPKNEILGAKCVSKQWYNFLSNEKNCLDIYNYGHLLSPVNGLQFLQAYDKPLLNQFCWFIMTEKSSVAKLERAVTEEKLPGVICLHFILGDMETLLPGVLKLLRTLTTPNIHINFVNLTYKIDKSTKQSWIRVFQEISKNPNIQYLNLSLQIPREGYQSKINPLNFLEKANMRKLVMNAAWFTYYNTSNTWNLNGIDKIEYKKKCFYTFHSVKCQEMVFLPSTHGKVGYGSEYLFGALKDNTALRILDLSNTTLRWLSLRQVFLPQMTATIWNTFPPSLEYLDMSGSSVGAVGWGYMGKYFTRLETLDLHQSSFWNLGPLREILSSTKTIRHLNMFENCVGNFMEGEITDIFRELNQTVINCDHHQGDSVLSETEINDLTAILARNDSKSSVGRRTKGVTIKK